MSTGKSQKINFEGFAGLIICFFFNFQNGGGKYKKKTFELFPLENVTQKIFFPTINFPQVKSSNLGLTVFGSKHKSAEIIANSSMRKSETGLNQRLNGTIA